MKWLVTGGLGVIGGLFAEERLRVGDEVAVIDAAEKPRNIFVLEKLGAMGAGMRLAMSVERLERSDLAAALGWADAVVHAAAHTGIPHSSEDPGDDWVSNVDATRVLLEGLRMQAAGGRKVPTVIMSSVKPYSVDGMAHTREGDRYVWTHGPELGIDERWPLEPDEPYAASKMAQSGLAMAYARTYDLPIVTLRFSNLYGPAPCHGPRHGWLTWFCIQRELGQVPEIQGTGLQVRDMLYSNDINAALRVAIEQAEKLGGRVFNVGGGMRNTASVLEAAKLIWDRGFVPTEAPGRKREDPIFITDHSAFTAATGWRPHVTVDVGAALVRAWARENERELRDLYREHLR